MNTKWLAAAAGLVALAGGAHASVTVFGNGLAKTCYDSAEAGRSDAAAEAQCTQALDGDALVADDRAGTFVNRGIMKLRRGEYEPAHADFNAAIALAPKIGEAWVNRGAMFVGEKQYSAGLADITKGLALGVKQPEKAYFDRALAYEGLDDEKSAYFDYQQAVTLKPDWPLPQRELLRFTVTHR